MLWTAAEVRVRKSREVRRDFASDSSRKLLASSLGAALFILSLGALDTWTRGSIALPALLPPFGASTVIVFFSPESHASRTWNVIVGHLGSALIALAVLALLPSAPVATKAALAVSLAAVAMAATSSVHPPGGATALLAVISQPQVAGIGFVIAVALGCLMLVGLRRAHDMLLAPLAERSVGPSEALTVGESTEGPSP